jgi:nucleoid-associated protein YgaU
MDPAIVFCAGVAVSTLAAGIACAALPLTRRLMRLRVPMPVRSLAAVVLVASSFTVSMRQRPASASVAPPTVRLGDGAADPSGGRDAGAGTLTSAPAHEAPSTGSSTTGAATYVVQSGDCLWRIARSVLAERSGRAPTSTEIARFWPAIYATNRAVIGDDPNLIFPGQDLAIPEG